MAEDVSGYWIRRKS